MQLQLLFELVDLHGPVILVGALAVFGELGLLEIFSCSGFGDAGVLPKFFNALKKTFPSRFNRFVWPEAWQSCWESLSSPMSRDFLKKDL
jgi:hypothetical protein